MGGQSSASEDSEEGEKVGQGRGVREEREWPHGKVRDDGNRRSGCERQEKSVP